MLPLKLLTSMYNFNPHPHVEGDRVRGPKMVLRETISIHTLTWRVTCAGSSSVGIFINFNPHPHVEGDLCCVFTLITRCDFNPHPHVEGDASSSATRYCVRRSRIFPLLLP